ncbi:MAG: phosphatase [Bacteroidota bacterium]
MNNEYNIFTELGGKFLVQPEIFLQKLDKITCVLFDWDGVFNSGEKGEGTTSHFYEADSMGTNLLRFALWGKNQQNIPIAGVLSGASSPSARTFVLREHFHFLATRFKHKSEAIEVVCQQFNLKPEEILWVYDDVLDVSAARMCGLRVMVRRTASPLFTQYVEKEGLAEYITAHAGGNFAVREISELLIGLMGKWEETLAHRTTYSSTYRTYLEIRQAVQPQALQRMVERIQFMDL